MSRARAAVAAAASFVLLAIGPADAKTLLVGPDREFKAPSAAARVAQDGDTVAIDPVEGGYIDCAIWKANHLTIEGVGLGVIVTDRTCVGKAIFITDGTDTTIRNLTFARARVPDQNGAGIRAEGANLRIEHSRFVNNEVGLLAAAPDGVMIIIDSDFTDNGACPADCMPSLSVSGLTLLHVERSRFGGGKGGDYIKSLATRTELIGNEIIDGPSGASRFLVELPAGGSLVMRDNVLGKGPRASAGEPAVAIVTGLGAPPVAELTFIGNRVTNDGPEPLVFVRDWTGTAPVFDNNTIGERVIPLSSDGYRWFMTKAYLHALVDYGQGLVGTAKHALAPYKGTIEALKARLKSVL